MSITLADQYYLKALDEFEYSYEDSIENINYALSYDPDHAGANYLMGKVYMNHFQRFELAEECFTTAMATEPGSLNTCEGYAWLLIKMERFGEAIRLIDYACTIPGVDRPVFIHLKALVYELKKEFEIAMELLRLAKNDAYKSSFIQFIDDEMDRIRRKQQDRKQIRYNLD